MSSMLGVPWAMEVLCPNCGRHTTGNSLRCDYCDYGRTNVDAVLPDDSAARKDIPLCRGVFDYFPAALAEVAKLSQVGNEKHNPGEDLHHARDKSGDHADCLLRHLVERGTIDTDGLSHTVKVAWRALALLQEECERDRGASRPRGAR